MARRSGGRGGWGGRGARGGYTGGGRSSRGSNRGRLRPTFPRRTWTTTHGTANHGKRTVQHSFMLPKFGGSSRTTYVPGTVPGAPPVNDTGSSTPRMSSSNNPSGGLPAKNLRGATFGKSIQYRTPGKR